MSRYTQTFLFNMFIVTLLVLASGYHLTIELAASIHGNPLVTSLWVFIWVMSIGTGIEAVKDAWRHDREVWLAEVVPPLFPEGAAT